MPTGKGSKLLRYVEHRLQVTLFDGRNIVGTFLAFDKHLNLVLSEAEEFRTLKSKSSAAVLEERTEKRSLGLVLIRGENVVSLAVEGPSPPHQNAAPALPGGPGQARGAGRGIAPPSMSNNNPNMMGRGGGPAMGLGAAPVYGVGGMPPPPIPCKGRMVKFQVAEWPGGIRRIVSAGSNTGSLMANFFHFCGWKTPSELKNSLDEAAQYSPAGETVLSSEGETVWSDGNLFLFGSLFNEDAKELTDAAGFAKLMGAFASIAAFESGDGPPPDPFDIHILATGPEARRIYEMRKSNCSTCVK